MKIEISQSVELTPELLAKIFWGMSATEQAAFFRALAIETKNSDAYGYGELQWCHMRDEVVKDPEAHRQYAALGLWAYNFMPPEWGPSI